MQRTKLTLIERVPRQVEHAPFDRLRLQGGGVDFIVDLPEPARAARHAKLLDETIVVVAGGNPRCGVAERVSLALAQHEEHVGIGAEYPLLYRQGVLLWSEPQVLAHDP